MKRAWASVENHRPITLQEVAISRCSTVVLDVLTHFISYLLHLSEHFQ